MKPSASFIFTILFFGFILHSLWNLVGIFRIPTCAKGEVCFRSFLNNDPNLELLVYVSDSARFRNSELILNLDNFDYLNSWERDVTISLSKTVRNNGSMFITSVIIPQRRVKHDLSVQEAMKFDEGTVVQSYLTKYVVPKSYAFNLLEENVENKTQSYKSVTHIKSRYAILMCTDKFGVPRERIPPEIIRHLRINKNYMFMPIVLEDFMQIRLKDLVEINSATKEITFKYVYNPSTIGKLRFVLQIEATLTQFLTLGFTEKDMDEIKGVFVDTNLYLLCATTLIGSIHLLLDFLSFKNDVSFWKRHQSMAGLSTRTVLWRAFSQTVIFLYLMDEGTSLLVLIPAGIGTVIEFWKVKKVLRGSFTWERGFRFIQHRTETKEEALTRKYDEECMKYLSYLLYPLCLGGAVYSLLYQPHKSWYSWTINSLVNGVYAFGFLFMLPQLFVNYRLKSVAALPWKAFTYKAFNTFIDDIFAFIITMPTAHRVACFRDDVVFLIYLYQRWLYPVDKSRRDEMATEDQDDKKTK